MFTEYLNRGIAKRLIQNRQSTPHAMPICQPHVRGGYKARMSVLLTAGSLGFEKFGDSRLKDQLKRFILC